MRLSVVWPWWTVLKSLQERHLLRTSVPYFHHYWAGTWQNQQIYLCVQRWLKSAWASAQSDQTSVTVWRKFRSLATCTHWAHSEDYDQWVSTSSFCWCCFAVSSYDITADNYLNAINIVVSETKEQKVSKCILLLYPPQTVFVCVCVGRVGILFSRCPSVRPSAAV